MQKDSMSSVRYVLLFLFVCSCFSCYNIGVDGGNRLLSEEDEIELEKKLKLLNKPAVKSILTRHGDIYDCVDFYKQPAFDHHLLKNHTFHPQMRPSSVPILTREMKLYKVESNHTGLERVACPYGTVPIRRTTKDDLIREKIHSEKYDNEYSILTDENPGTHYALVRSKFDPKKKYNGVGASLYTYIQPVLPSQYVSSRIKIQNGGESIQVGWTINPSLYGDNHIRYYIYFNGKQPGCFNVRCPGFVIVNQDVPLDSVLDQVQYVPSFIYKDPETSNWWFATSSAGIMIGFWPAPLFDSLTAGSGTSVDWGGKVYSPTNVPSPPMGLGRLPSTFVPPISNAWNTDLVTINEANQRVDAHNTIGYRDNKKYGVVDVGYLGKKVWSGYGMFYGGPGGAKGK